MRLKKCPFGRTGLRVSELCLGTSNFARFVDRRKSFAILDAFRAAGGNFFQTTGLCPGASLDDSFLGLPEELLGRWLRDRKVNRGSVIIATRIALARPVIGGIATYTELIRGCAQDSIRRIGCGFLDFLVVEWTNAIVPVDESVAALRAVIASGEIRYIVPANFPTQHAREALTAFTVAPRLFAGLQFDYSRANRTRFEGDAEALCVDGGLGMVARSPFAGGALVRRPLTSIFGALRCRPASERPTAIIARTLWPILTGTARSSRSSPAKVALAWVLAHPQITAVIVNVRSVSQLRELIKQYDPPLPPLLVRFRIAIPPGG